MSARQAKALVIGMRGEGGARRARFLAPHLRTVGAVDFLRVAAQSRNLIVGKAIGQEQITPLVEFPELLGGQPHGDPPLLTVAAMMSQRERRFQQPRRTSARRAGRYRNRVAASTLRSMSERRDLFPPIQPHPT